MIFKSCYLCVQYMKHIYCFMRKYLMKVKILHSEHIACRQVTATVELHVSFFHKRLKQKVLVYTTCPSRISADFTALNPHKVIRE